MKTRSFCHRKCFLTFFNILLMVCGVVVLASGFYLFTDQKKLMLSSLLIVTPDESNPLKDLDHPFFFYVAFLLTILGMMIFSVSVFGYWSLFFENYFVLTTYFILVLMLLLLKFAFSIVITIWPQCLGLNLNSTEMVKILQGNYGVPSMEQYSNAMDFAQTSLDCCGFVVGDEYDTSLWRLQPFGKKELAVPLTCCKLMNKFESHSYLDPKPINITLCQSVDSSDFQKSRHLDGCLDKIEYWYREHYIVLLCGGLVLSIVEFLVLLCIVLSCKRTKQRASDQRQNPLAIFTEEDQPSNPSDSLHRHRIFQDDVNSISPEIKEVFVQPKYLHRDTSSKFHGNNYNLKFNYLI